MSVCYIQAWSAGVFQWWRTGFEGTGLEGVEEIGRHGWERSRESVQGRESVWDVMSGIFLIAFRS